MSLSTTSEDAGSGSAEDWRSNNSGSASGVSTTSVNTDGASNCEKEEHLAQAESRAVFRLRLLVILILFLAAAAVSGFIHLLTSNAEHDEYVAQFHGSATIVLQRFEDILNDSLGAISTVSVAMTAHAADLNKDWPFVSMSFIQQRFSKTNQIAGAMYLGFNPFVRSAEKQAWEEFTSNPETSYWIRESLEYQERTGLSVFDEATADDPFNEKLVGSSKLAIDTFDWEDPAEGGPGPYLPVWQTSPVLRQDLVNKNRYHEPIFAYWANLTLQTGSAVLGGMDVAPPGYSVHPNKDTRFFSTILSMSRKERTKYLGDPMTDIFVPVFDSFNEDRTAVAVLHAVFHWQSYFRNILPLNTPDMNLVLTNSCQGHFTYIMYGNKIEPVGEGDLHDREYEDSEEGTSFEGLEDVGDGTEFGLKLNQDECRYSLSVYPTQDYYEEYNTNTPVIMTIIVAMVRFIITVLLSCVAWWEAAAHLTSCLVALFSPLFQIFVFAMCMFFFYDYLVERRQRIIMAKAQQTTAIVSSLFPKAVRERLMADEADKKKTLNSLKNYLGGEKEEDFQIDGSKDAIADLIPKSTVMFADISGFTAWSSARDPSQVFYLLQTIYQAFDVLAKRRRVFKVETIGDCYMAVTGLPNPQPNHAIIMAKFADECRKKLTKITQALEVTLGPDTGDLSMRFGMHSGPVTAGVLRGDRSRFQLFGDTVNTAARMESTGESNKIQLSETTAKELKEAGKETWIVPRKDLVKVKGKGVLQTYWLTPSYKKKSSASDAQSLVTTTTTEENGHVLSLVDSLNTSKNGALLEKEGRRIDWVAGLFEEHLKKVIATRPATNKQQKKSMAIYEPVAGKIPLDEVTDTVTLTEFDEKKAKIVSGSIILADEVVHQIRDYVAAIADMYRNNPFHSFDHACHVTMSVVKLLKRVVTPEIDVNDYEYSDLASKLHDYTYGLTFDPMATLAIIFSALIHDVDHRGVSNVQLETEEPEMAECYRSKSIAEQNSLDLAWGILMQHKFRAFRSQLFIDDDDINHFRQVAVNVVLATDIFDKELNALRKDRWNRAFSEHHQEHAPDDKALKATIVIEHIIQASDVSHTMQHWHIYRRWNEQLFMEMSAAYKAGRMSADPATFWYQGEIGFFDNYIIPLAKKLKYCGVFGVSSDEYLNYAVSNRDEWKEKGEAIVEELLEKRGFK
jgi:class 3 adenylate cyclase